MLWTWVRFPPPPPRHSFKSIVSDAFFISTILRFDSSILRFFDSSEEYFQKYMFDKSRAEFYVESEVEQYHRKLRTWSEEMEVKAKRVWESKRLKALAVPVLPVLTNDSDSYIEEIHVHMTFPRDKVILLKELPDEEAYPVKPKKPQYLLKSNVSRGLEMAMKLSDSLNYMFPTEASGPSFKMDNFILSNV